ncbi:ABC transporter ATP-binding protein [Ktedonosporobacter rubrisoli]|uniref:ABC transporter ATP-binding protein n=1 Tax=Ktedonosporobacter rubrisoli TaxID=2509675 RepID=A0A4V0YYB4_KTERU|nr:ABC transporter ATP-binding protein [Ktedonosporobacter rubrisoli]QBD75631.1 ABC transporter ATP-binding protein [Ktedonosporobacter rubrisoli]
MDTSAKSLPAISITALSKHYRLAGKSVRKAVDQLDLSIAQGQIYGLLGANGAGKTTIIKMLCGLIIPTSGHIVINGYDLARERYRAVQQIGAVLEGTRNVYWRLSAWENLLYFGRLKGCRERELRIRARQLLEELELWERRNSAVRTFSRGMQQKVAIACAVIADPSIVLLDEPTLGLDIQAARTVKDWVAKLAREQGKTVILTTHQLDIAQQLCERVAIMRHGQLLADQPLTHLLKYFREEHYQIRLRGQLSSEQAALFAPLNMSYADGESCLTGLIGNQAQLYRYLADIERLQLPLLAVQLLEPSLEEVFMRLLSAGKEVKDHVA